MNLNLLQNVGFVLATSSQADDSQDSHLGVIFIYIYMCLEFVFGAEMECVKERRKSNQSCIHNDRPC